MAKFGLVSIGFLKKGYEGCEYEVLSRLPPKVLERICGVAPEFYEGQGKPPRILAQNVFHVRYKNSSMGHLKATRSKNLF